MSDQPTIRIRDLKKSFGDKVVLDGANLDVWPGESVVVIGQSGVGKSVLIKCIIGILTPDSGTIEIDGENITAPGFKNMDIVRRKFGMLFQYAALFDSLTVWENVGFALTRHTKMKTGQIREIAEEKLRMVGLPGTLDLMPSELSGGMRKRVGLARAIAMEPAIMLYDEPTTGLDPIRGDSINDLIIQLREELGVASVTITHDMISAYKIADRITMLYKGKLIATGTPDEIRGSDNPYVQQFIHGRAEGPIRDE
ncbi:MAG: ABC transporter ATP-binding protein [bacterium]|nr:ABC transporter ATP-binding protein [bacterium]MDT8366021.1 ABC transporter ATP-binding protein [bacterium]